MTDTPASAPAHLTYSLTLDGNGITVKRDVSESVASAILNIVMGGAPVTVATPPAAGSAPIPSVARGTALPQSVREFLDETDAKRNPDKIAAIAAYLKSQGQDSFSRDEVKQQFPKAGESIPANYSRDFSLAVSTGWIAEHANTGTFYITAKGEKAVSGGFSEKIRRPTTKRKPRKPDANSES